MTLRTRLLLALAILLAAGTIVTDVSAVAALHSYLLDQVDKQLVAAQDPVEARLLEEEAEEQRLNAMTRSGNESSHLAISDFYVEIRSDQGVMISQVPSLFRAQDDPAPAVTAQQLQTRNGKGPFTVSSVDPESSIRYRAIVGDFGSGRDKFVIASPLRNIENTTHRLDLIETVATIAVLLALVSAGFFVIRSDLRPLEDMADTAAAIAAGDLSQRIERDDDKTEVGRLGRALNTMLSQIEMGFAERRAAEDRLRRFVADASHELRTPLTAIRGYAELHRQGAIAGEGHRDEVMRRIEEEATRMGVMVEDLLLLARLDQRRALEYSTVDMSSLVRDVVADARVSAADRHIEFTPSDKPLWVSGERARLHQVLANLVTNAFVHTPPHTRVEIVLRSQGGEVIVDVSDNGPGLEPGSEDKAFERFYRADTGRSRARGGTGLGLAIVKSLVEAHNGRVWVKSAPGEGATFSIALPAIAASTTESEQKASDVELSRRVGEPDHAEE